MHKSTASRDISITIPPWTLIFGIEGHLEGLEDSRSPFVFFRLFCFGILYDCARPLLREKCPTCAVLGESYQQGSYWELWT